LGSPAGLHFLIGGGSNQGPLSLADPYPVSLFITGTLYYAIPVPFSLLFVFKYLRAQWIRVLPEFWSLRRPLLQKFIYPLDSRHPPAKNPYRWHCGQ
jgi:hypothetical protein